MPTMAAVNVKYVKVGTIDCLAIWLILFREDKEFSVIATSVHALMHAKC